MHELSHEVRLTDCIYLQNSGLGNIVNPILSLVNKKVYKIQIYFLIGWRVETKTKLIATETTPNPKYNPKPKTQQI